MHACTHLLHASSDAALANVGAVVLWLYGGVGHVDEAAVLVVALGIPVGVRQAKRVTGSSRLPVPPTAMYVAAAGAQAMARPTASAG